MIDELPDLPDIFNENHNEEIDDKDSRLAPSDKDIYIYISKENDKWISVTFIDIAPSGIGLHVMLPFDIKFNVNELNKARIKFEKKKKGSSIVLKETPILIRWQEKDPVSGKIKLGLHLHGDVKLDPVIIDILNTLKG